MTDAPVESDVGKNLPVAPGLAVSGLKRPIPAFRESVSIAANFVAAFLSFVFLIVAPTILWEFVPLSDDFATIFVQFVPMGLLERTTAALGVALLFFMTGIGLHLWHLRRGLAFWWPLVLAFPVVGVLLVPEALAGGESIWAWGMFGAAIALAFCMHWLIVLAAAELID
jgi:hypothetical protein